jgi:hypothetical protein
MFRKDRAVFAPLHYAKKTELLKREKENKLSFMEMDFFWKKLTRRAFIL